MIVSFPWKHGSPAVLQIFARKSLDGRGDYSDENARVKTGCEQASAPAA
jgi:hypothetical protein